MNPRIIGVALFILLILGVIGYTVLAPTITPLLAPVLGSQCQQHTVTGVLGSEKDALMRDPAVIKLLKDKYCITLNYVTMGSIAQVTTPQQGKDFLWPSNAVAAEIYKNNGGKGTIETIFRSPIVIYSWHPVADALVKQSIVQKVNDIYYIVDMPKLTKIMLDGTKWSDVGLPDVYGKIAVISSDPTKSNSGNMFYLLLGAMLNGGNVVDSSTVETVAPKLYKYYQSMGYLEDGSEKVFGAYISEGMGAKPLSAGYENQASEFVLQNPGYKDEILKNVVYLYPKPTVWADHPLIALNANGESLLTALKDPQIQDIAWKQHGFRTGIAGIQNNAADLGLAGLPTTIDSVMPLPKAEVALRIIQYLQTGQ